MVKIRHWYRHGETTNTSDSFSLMVLPVYAFSGILWTILPMWSLHSMFSGCSSFWILKLIFPAFFCSGLTCFFWGEGFSCWAIRSCLGKEKDLPFLLSWELRMTLRSGTCSSTGQQLWLRRLPKCWNMSSRWLPPTSNPGSLQVGNHPTLSTPWKMPDSLSYGHTFPFGWWWRQWAKLMSLLAV